MKIEKKDLKRIAWEILFVILAGIGSAFALYVFVYPNNFAPGGVNGITTMLQYITLISAGWWALIINLSLLVIAWFILKKKYVSYVVLYTIVSSLLVVLLQEMEFYEYFAVGEGLLAAIFSGIILGAMTGLMLAVGGSSGGLDTVACMIQRKRPQFKIERIISVFCYIIVLCSYFVYEDLNCILLALVHIFTYEKGMGFILSQKRKREKTEEKMGILTDTHSHTYPSSHDGKNTLREMIEGALEKQVTYYGISNHFDYDYDEKLMTEEEKKILPNGDEEEYFRDARFLQKEYEEKIKVLVGAEFGYSERKEVQEQYRLAYEKHRPDYVINSVHSNEGRDFSRTALPKDKKGLFELYLRLVRQSLDVPYHYDIVGHIEYIVRYVPFAEKKIELGEFQEQIDDILKRIIEKGKILEVNTATFGLERVGLPNEEVLARYYELGGRRVTFGSDAHTTARILEGREKVVATLKKIGFEYLTIPVCGEYTKIPL